MIPGEPEHLSWTSNSSELPSRNTPCHRSELETPCTYTLDNSERSIKEGGTIGIAASVGHNCSYCGAGHSTSPTSLSPLQGKVGPLERDGSSLNRLGIPKSELF